MTKPRRYGGKSHSATPTQEQTRPISTEFSNLVGKITLFVIFPAKTGIEKTKDASWWPNRADMVGKLISRPQLRSRRDQWRRKLAIFTENTLFLIGAAQTGIVETKVANWWPNRADMVGNLISRPQLKSRRDQWRRKLAIFTLKKLFLISPAKTSLE